MKKLKGFYGSGKTPCNVYYYNGWYAVEGSVNVNFTYDDVEDGIDVEELTDEDFFTSSFPIFSIEDLYNAVEE